MSDPRRELFDRLRRVATLSSVGALLEWDQETMMPPLAAPFRAEQAATVAELAHRERTHPRIGELIAACEAQASPDPLEAANLREIRRDYDRSTRLPADLVAEMTRTSSRAMEAWKQARQDSDYAAFRPWLERQFELMRRKAACLGVPPGGEPYDALLEDYEPGMTAAQVAALFAPLRAGLAPLIAEVAASGREPDTAPLRVRVPVDRQKAFNRHVAAALGYDFQAGRLDVSAHPVTHGLAPGDCRITTRYAEDQVLEALSSTMHEAGHALYEQGLPKEARFGQPVGEASSLGIHESQSRLWENQVGRSRAFWRWALPQARTMLGPEFGAFDEQALHRAVNRVKPGLIRVESDEATYNLHVMLRFDLERAMLREDLAPADLPGAWSDRMRADLGVEVPDDRRGCLQDIHWSAGAIGYFPTYTLGNVCAAQLWEAACRQLPGLEEAIGRGEFAPLLEWLREAVHRHGRRWPAPELVAQVTGRTPEPASLLAYLEGKLKPLYGLA